MSYFVKEPHPVLNGKVLQLKQYRDSAVYEVIGEHPLAEVINNATFIEDEEWQAMEALQIARSVKMARDLPAFDSEGTYL